MVANMEALGDAVTGVVVATAFEPGDPIPGGHTHENCCLNCGLRLNGTFCHRCGQSAHIHNTLTAFFHDLAHGVFHVEGKLWNTIPMLGWRPGELTRRYIDGQRARFVSPIALFLFCVFLMFGIVGLTSNTTTATNEARSHAATELRNDQRKLDGLAKERTSATGPATAKLDEKISDMKAEMIALQAVRDGKFDAAVRLRTGFLGGFGETMGEQLRKAASNPELLFYKLKTNAYKFSWALIPISVPFVWLLFPFSRRFGFYDHTVFVTYSLCFMMLLLAASSMLGLISQALASLAWFTPPVHMYRQLRGTYAVSAGGAAWRTALLTIFAFIAIALFATLLVTLGALE